MSVKPLKKLQYWHYEFARDLAVGKHISQLEHKWGRKPWSKSTSTIKRCMHDPLILAERDKINELANIAIARSKSRLQLMVHGKAFDIVERELDREPFDPSTGEGDIQCNPKHQSKLAVDLIKELQLGKVDETKRTRITVLFGDEKVEIEREEEEDDGSLEIALNKVKDE